jgi:nucleoside-diphosphate kinase
MVWEGREAVQVARTLMGATDGTKAPPATIRGDFALSVQNNLVHGSDSPENASAEIALWFRPDELLSYKLVDSPWVEAKN